MHFTKMQGIGNDYLYAFIPEDGAPSVLSDPSEWAVRLSDRHFGVGSDGLILLSPSPCADFRMRIFNADGSEARMCGNGIRCAAKFLYDKHLTRQTDLTVETLAGLRQVSLLFDGGEVWGASVDMGEVSVDDPLRLTAAGAETEVIPVSVGNPHAVCFTGDAENAPLTTVGAAVSSHSAFPGGVNAEFAQILGRNRIRMRVWERGSGITLACGTGACACAAAAVRGGFCDPETEIEVQADGGRLMVKITADSRAILTGPAVTVCECDV